MNSDELLNSLRNQIAETVRGRDALKQDIESGSVTAARGLRELVAIDEKLSQLDIRFKQLWDSQKQKEA